MLEIGYVVFEVVRPLMTDYGGVTSLENRSLAKAWANVLRGNWVMARKLCFDWLIN